MPNYFPEGDTPLATDSKERSMAKAVSLLPSALDTLMVDPDVAAYVALSGATDVANLDAFVKGVKELGLWNSMVCWPLRLTQNAGQGDTVYSLGGLGTYNGTRVNAPLWATNGLNFLTGNTTSRVTTTLPLSQPFSFYGCMHFATNLYSGGTLIGQAANVNTYVKNGFSTPANKVLMVSSGTALASSNTYTALQKCFIQGYYNGASSNLSLNGTTVTGNVGSGSYNSLIIGSSVTFGSGYSDANKNYEIAFVMAVPSRTVNSSVYSIYKETLGAGLNLP